MANSVDIKSEQEAFEMWVKSHGGNVDWLGDGEYRSAPTECAWNAWQARAALFRSQEDPKEQSDYSNRYRVEHEGRRYVIKCGTGTRNLCQRRFLFERMPTEIALELQTAFNDGRFVGQQEAVLSPSVRPVSQGANAERHGWPHDFKLYTVERLREAMTTLGIATDDSMECFSADLENMLLSMCRVISSMNGRATTARSQEDVRKEALKEAEAKIESLRETISDPCIIGAERAEAGHNTLTACVAAIRSLQAQGEKARLPIIGCGTCAHRDTSPDGACVTCFDDPNKAFPRLLNWAPRATTQGSQDKEQG